jgi:peptidoglycan-associated lipoprotein
MRERTLGLAILAAALVVAGCTTVRNARDRIVKAPPVCEDMTVQIYFEPESAQISRDGRMVLGEAAGQAHRCRVDRVTVTGLADAAGAPLANLELSKRRAAAVTQALASTGLPAAEFDLQAAGQSGAVTPAGVTPLRRRADVRLELSAPR